MEDMKNCGSSVNHDGIKACEAVVFREEVSVVLLVCRGEKKEREIMQRPKLQTSISVSQHHFPQGQLSKLGFKKKKMPLVLPPW